MTKSQYKIKILVLMSLIILIVIGKCVMLYKTKFDIDNLQDQLRAFQNKMPFNTPIGFNSNINEKDKYILYLSVKNVMAPRIFLYQADLDTLLVVQQKEKDLLPFNNYRVIDKTENKSTVISLIVKLK